MDINHCEDCGYQANNVFRDYCPECGSEDYIVIEKEPKWFCVSIYLVNRAYGGPEEGGWYFTCGEPVERAQVFLKTFWDFSQALMYRDRLQNALNICWNYGRPSISSVLSQGRFEALIDEESIPKPFPQQIPHFE